MITLKDVALRANVSIATASYVINGSKTTSDDVRQRVKLAASELGYRPNRAARALKTGENHFLGLIVPDLQNPFFPKLVQAVERRSREVGYGLSLIDVSEDPRVEREAFEQLAAQGVAAVIDASLRADPPDNLPYPLIALDTPRVGIDSVYADHRAGGYLSARQALSQGHSRFGLLSGPQDVSSARLRREGVLEGLNGRAEVVWEFSVAFSIELPEEVIIRLRDLNVTAIIAGSDVIAIGVMHVLHEFGSKLPDDVSLIGFDDISWASLLRPRLTTVRQPILEMGTHAVDLALRRLKMPNAPVLHEMLSVMWVAGASCAPPKSTTSRGDLRLGTETCAKEFG